MTDVLPTSTPQATSEVQWFVMRDLTRNNAHQPAFQLLGEEGFEVFTPLQWKLVTRRGKTVREQVPFIHDLLFVHSTQDELTPIVERTNTLQYRYVRGAYRQPMIVGEREMTRFIKAVRATDSPHYYLPSELTPAMYKRQIRIIGGPLDGYEGRLLTVRGSKTRRLLVELPNLLTLAVEVNPEYIQLL